MDGATKALSTASASGPMHDSDDEDAGDEERLQAGNKAEEMLEDAVRKLGVEPGVPVRELAVGVAADGRECKECPARNAPNEDHTDCFCQANTYSALEVGIVTCHGTSFSSDGMDNDECAVCPSCLDCAVVG